MTLESVKERELPEADDEFAQIASPFDTISELKDDIKEQVGRSKVFQQGAQARDQVVDALLKSVDIPVPPKLVEDEVHRHLENEDASKTMCTAPRSRPRARPRSVRRSCWMRSSRPRRSRSARTSSPATSCRSAAQYGMEPGEFIQVLDKNGQVPAMIAEVPRNKALATVLDKAKVVDGKGKAVDISDFTKSVLGEPGGEIVDAASLAGADHDDHDDTRATTTDP